MTRGPRSKEARELVREVEAAGGSVEITKRGHLKIRGPLGFAIVSAHWRNHHDRRNARTDAVRYSGLDLP